MRSDKQAQGALATEWQSTSADLQAESALQRRRGESSRTAWETIRLVVLQLFMTFLVVTFLVPTFWMISSSLKVSTEVFAHPIVWLPQDPHWNNYVKAFQLLPLTRFIYNTLIIVSVCRRWEPSFRRRWWPTRLPVSVGRGATSGLPCCWRR